MSNVTRFKNFISISKCFMLASATMLVATSASLYAQADRKVKDSAGEDPAPIAPRLPPGESPGVKRQAGVGGNLAYAEAGVVELGGAIRGTSAKDYYECGFAPMAGYFFANNLQISALANANYTKVKNVPAKSVGSLLVEPSVHMPLTNTNFVFLGVGAGGLFQKGEKPGFAIAPRVGYKNLVGRSGMLTVDFQAVYGLNEADVQTGSGTVLTVQTAFIGGVGFTVLL